MNISDLNLHRLSIITGHYGTGKTEISVNLALLLAQSGKKTALADLDIVNPYFRSRERKGLFEQNGIRLVTSAQECSNADIPALPPEIQTLIQDRSYHAVFDIGGDPVGARVLARFAPAIQNEDHCLIYVVNANRPEASTAEKALQYLRRIEETSTLRCGGIINNTHLCGETTADDVLKGAALAKALSEKTGIPVICHSAVERLLPALRSLEPKLFQVNIYMKKPWERS